MIFTALISVWSMTANNHHMSHVIDGTGLISNEINLEHDYIFPFQLVTRFPRLDQTSVKKWIKKKN